MSSTKRWYVEATGHTNEVIARELAPEDAHKGLLCRDEKKRDLWECDYAFIAKLVRNEVQAGLKFKVFYRESTNGPLKPWPFLKRKLPPKKGTVKKGAASQHPSS